MAASCQTRAAHIILIFALWIVSVFAYIPAQATNRTDLVPVTSSSIQLVWSFGSYDVPVSFQLTGSGSLGYSRGAIVHYSEHNATSPPSLSPFIALICCDRNITNTTLENDIFTMANSSGAVAALLYTTTAQACLINPEYADPTHFDRILDVYTTVRTSSAKLIQSQFGEVNRSYYWYDSARLNDSFEAIELYATGAPIALTPGFLMATLIANMSNPTNGSSPSNPPSGGDGGDSSPNTSLAMIILYSITGCVSALFLIVILSGAVRAFRHPERYGPRLGTASFESGLGPGMGGAPAQSRAAGLGRAVLDSFPLVKFGAATESNAHPTDGGASPAKPVDLESNGTSSIHRLSDEVGREAIEMMMAIDTTARTSPDVQQGPFTPGPPAEIGETHDDDAHDGDGEDPGHVLDPSAIGKETCPICIADFKNGDDLRVLPCEGRHRFHQACVDPWLLELSSSCPICRADFGKLESMAAATAPESSSSFPVPTEAAMDDPFPPPPPGHANINASNEAQSNLQNSAARFARYLVLAQNRRMRNRHSAGTAGRGPFHHRHRDSSTAAGVFRPESPQNPASGAVAPN